MRKVDRRNEMAELDERATDGQIADHLGAELSGDFGAWNLGIVEYRCPKCDLSVYVQGDALRNYMDLIVGWHLKAAGEDDYFSQFVFEYLAFIAHLRTTVFYKESNDRNVIQSLKRDKARCGRYMERVKADSQLASVLQHLIKELAERPLHNSSHDPDYPEIDKWWNSSGPHPSESEPRGVIRSMDDWENLVEFWYGVRNNLFHGGKSPSVTRDIFLVEHAYKTLKVFMDEEVPMTTAGQKAAVTRRRRQAAGKAARTRRLRAAGRKAAATRKRRAAARKAAATRSAGR
jgi:hypothetical protein